MVRLRGSDKRVRLSGSDKRVRLRGSIEDIHSCKHGSQILRASMRRGQAMDSSKGKPTEGVFIEGFYSVDRTVRARKNT